MAARVGEREPAHAFGLVAVHGEALQHALDLTLNGEVGGRAEQLAAALERARGGGV